MFALNSSEYGFIKKAPILIFIIMTQNLIILVPNISIGTKSFTLIQGNPSKKL